MSDEYEPSEQDEEESARHDNGTEFERFMLGIDEIPF